MVYRGPTIFLPRRDLPIAPIPFVNNLMTLTLMTTRFPVFDSRVSKQLTPPDFYRKVCELLCDMCFYII